MAATITWEVKSLERVIKDGGVVDVQWCCLGSDTKDGKEYSETIYVSTPLDKYNASDGSFIQYKDLTEAKIFEWVYTIVNKALVENRVKELLSEQMEATLTSDGLPW